MKKISHISPMNQVFGDCSTQDYVYSITLTVKYGGVFDFSSLPLEFELELN